MTYGLRQRDPQGNLLIDITTRLPRIMGRVEISAGVNGSVVVPASGTNPIFYYFCATSSSDTGSATPNFSDDGSVLTWTYGNYMRVGGTLVYGRY
ncbi:hypothetical protein [uncultured Stenotrophomonas sp.]|uniref:hypothetical protein n=1 Tax=uncultured Stenotrophomonas sp. TaxID=165438 RepID=UPI0025CF297B|nr:hypothetical protein [uncultured Stenotrophomonas sp.]